MLITTNEIERKKQWEYWLQTTNTNARILSKEEGSEQFNIDDKFQLLCDSRDFLFDFQSYKEKQSNTLKQKTEWNDNFPIVDLHWKNENIVGIEDSEGNIIPIHGKILFCLGNETRKFLRTPTLGITMAFQCVDPIDNPPFIACWRDKSSIQHFPSYTKIGCGMQGKISYLPSFQFLPLFFPFLKKSNYSFLRTTHSHIQQARNQMSCFPLSHSPIEECTVDVTPNFLPIVHCVGNAVFVYGMSGSGFTAFEPWFQDLIINTLEHGKEYPNPFSLRHCSSPEVSFLY
jgi:hypothetical protein